MPLRPFDESMKPILLGTCIGWQSTATGLQGTTAEASFRITFLGTRGIRLQIDPHARFEENPYALVETEIQELAQGHGFVEHATPQGPSHSLRFVSEHARFEMELNPLRFSLCTPDGRPLCVDDPGLGTAFQGTETSIYKTLQPGERFIGLGEKTGPLDRRGQAYTHWNTDFFGYYDDSDPLYLSTPFYMGLHQGRCYGLFLVNSHKSLVNFGASTHRFASVTTEAGMMDYILIAGAEPAEIVEFYTRLTGRSPLPPRWSLGLQQCRYSYYPDYEVTTLAETFRKKSIPADVIYLDIHYMDAYKVFTWSKSYYANPEALTKHLHSLGFKVVVIFDPGVKVEDDYPAYEEGLQGDHFVRYPDGELYQGQVWPGWCHFPDFTRAETRAWWGGMVKQVTDVGVEGFWTDMNEPATWGQKVPDILLFEMEGRGGSHKEAHNLYGMQMARATREGSGLARQGKRPFVLTRAGFSGVQRYAAVWTGDNRAEDGHMLLGARMLNAMGLAGVGFCGTDIGGFAGDADRELFARWMTIGAFSPLCRIHTMVDSRDSEPWSYGEKIEAISQNFINLRYRLMPLFYSLFKEMEERGLPVQRSLALSEPWAWQTYDHRYHNQFFVGKHLLVAPCSSTQHYAQVYLPSRNSDGWYYLYDDTVWPAGEPVAHAPLELLPVFVAPGAILPMRSVVQYEGQQDDGVFTLHIYRGSEPSSFDLYWDEGDGYAYKAGAYHRRLIEVFPGDNVLTLSEAKGSLDLPWPRLQILFHGYPQAGSVWVDGAEHALRQTRFRFVEPLPAFDPFGNDQTAYSCPVQMLELDNTLQVRTISLPC